MYCTQTESTVHTIIIPCTVQIKQILSRLDWNLIYRVLMYCTLWLPYITICNMLYAILYANKLWTPKQKLILLVTNIIKYGVTTTCTSISNRRTIVKTQKFYE